MPSESHWKSSFEIDKGSRSMNICSNTLSLNTSANNTIAETCVTFCKMAIGRAANVDQQCAVPNIATHIVAMQNVATRSDRRSTSSECSAKKHDPAAPERGHHRGAAAATV